jgi:hypothetical protein
VAVTEAAEAVLKSALKVALYLKGDVPVQVILDLS